MSASQIESIIMAMIGLFFTLQGYEIICIGKKPDVLDTERLAKWKKAQNLYKIGGPIVLIIGLAKFIAGQ